MPVFLSSLYIPSQRYQAQYLENSRHSLNIYWINEGRPILLWVIHFVIGEISDLYIATYCLQTQLASPATTVSHEDICHNPYNAMCYFACTFSSSPRLEVFWGQRCSQLSFYSPVSTTKQTTQKGLNKCLLNEQTKWYLRCLLPWQNTWPHTKDNKPPITHFIMAHNETGVLRCVKCWTKDPSQILKE